jgi:hypothetical protein
MGKFVRVAFSLSIAASFVACDRTSSHPASSFRRVGVLMSHLVKLQSECLAESGRYCSLDEQPMAVLKRWGDLRVEAPSRASFEVYDLQLLFVPQGFCVVAFPTRSPSSPARWMDSRGDVYFTDYPWLEVPSACDSPDRPKLVVE